MFTLHLISICVSSKNDFGFQITELKSFAMNFELKSISNILQVRYTGRYIFINL